MGKRKITVWEPSQWSVARARRGGMDGIDIENVRVISPYVGGGFQLQDRPASPCGSCLRGVTRTWAAGEVSLTRPQTFTGLGGRPATRQNLSIGATKDGKIVSIVQEGCN